MDLYIMRHGIAEDVSASGRDRDRVLTEEGRDKSREGGKALRKLDVEFDAIFSSAFPRAWQTAELVADELDEKKLLQELPELEAESNVQRALGGLKRVLKNQASVLIVGHEPILSQLISVLLSGHSGLSITMKKGAVCKLSCVRPEPGGCRLEWLLNAKQLCRMV
ncbi:MAG TPA: phosphohistidine phosphatase SixA [Verrucomicrobiae bacterium]